MRLAYDHRGEGGETMKHQPATDSTMLQGLALVAGLVTDEIFAAADPAQARGFFRAVGARLAAQHPIPSMRDLRELQGAVNAVWLRVGLGEAEITLDLRGVLIHHHDAPAAIPGDANGRWAEALPALLTGAYDGWMRAIGSPETLVTRVVAQSDDVVEIRHGADLSER